MAYRPGSQPPPGNQCTFTPQQPRQNPFGWFLHTTRRLVTAIVGALVIVVLVVVTALSCSSDPEAQYGPVTTYDLSDYYEETESRICQDPGLLETDQLFCSAGSVAAAAVCCQ